MAKYQASNFLTTSSATAQLDDELNMAQERIAELEEQIQQFTGESTSITSVQKLVLPISEINRDPKQVRRWFDPEKISSLAQAIRVNGFRGTVWVRYLPDGTPELVAGERRIRAAIEAGLDSIPVDVLDVDEDTAFTLGLLENLQREDLNALEETEGILGLLTRRLHCSQEDVTSLLYQMKNFHAGKSSESDERFSIVESAFGSVGRLTWLSFVTSRLPLLNLPEDVLEVLRQGQLEYTKARAIAKVKNAWQRESILEAAIEENLSLNEIRQRILQLRIGTEDEPEISLKQQFVDNFKRLQKSSAWKDPSKQEQLRKLIEQIQELASPPR